jgi:phosphate transport system substrate-binding protein
VKSKRFIITALLGLTLAASVIAGTASASGKGTLNGAGSTFVFPLVSLWQQDYHGARINYNPIGSGGGMQAICAHQVDFGASDAPLDVAQGYGCAGLVQIPWALAATSVPYHLSGVPGHMKITGKVLAKIYLCKITHWNDPAIKKLNKGVHLPSTKITPIHRSDSSGTTYNFTDYLSKVNKTFKHHIGNATLVNWPGCVIGAKGSSGVSAALKETNGSITYVDQAYSAKNHFHYFKVQNRAKKFVLPGVRGCNEARKTITKVPKNGEMHIVNPPKSKKKAYPICTFTYAMLWKHSGSKATALKKFVKWAISKGQTAPHVQVKLKFTPIGKKVRKADLKILKKVH